MRMATYDPGEARIEVREPAVSRFDGSQNWKNILGIGGVLQLSEAGHLKAAAPTDTLRKLSSIGFPTYP